MAEAPKAHHGALGESSKAKKLTDEDLDRMLQNLKA